MTSPVDHLNDTIHQRVRLGILVVLNESRRADFLFLREALGVTDGNLSRHLQVLEGAGLVRIQKTFEGKRPRTWISATKKGRSAFADEVHALRTLVNRIDNKSDST